MVGCLVATCIWLGCPESALSREKPDAEPGAVKVVILPIELRDLPADFAARLRSLVEKELGEIEKLSPVPATDTRSGIDKLKKRKQFRGCPDNQRCIKKIGASLGAGLVYHLHAAKSLGGIKFTMRGFSAETGLQLSKAADFAEQKPAEIERAIRWMTLKVASPTIKELATGTGKLLVECTEADAELIINGKPFGKKAGRRFTVASGVFDLVVNKEGYVPFHDLVMVKTGQVNVVKAELKPDPEAVKKKAQELAGITTPGGLAGSGPPEGSKPFLPGKPGEGAKPEPDETRFYQTWWFWTLVGIGVAGAGGTVAYLLLRDEGPSGQGGFEVIWQ